ncbi:hypothetical protein BV898_19766 [Hypsibius exemplaris]|uniref:Nitrate/nitrite sensing protein domain-containing protein n=1 Tax=Hypsibius exemplaris TaxID=2072580 RepID=A0A9X6NK93_HYPEX|nr:hypothetical protein BV898_19766 [Hypsibius exemplaris]
MDSGSDINKDQYERPSVTSTLSVGPYTTRQFLLLVQDSQATRRKRVLRLLFVMCVPILVLILQCAVTNVSASTYEGDIHSSDPWNKVWLSITPSAAARPPHSSSSGRGIGDLHRVRFTPAFLRHTLQTHRIDRSSNRTSISEVYWYAELIGGILRLVNRDVRLAGDTKGQLWRHLFALELFVNAKESLGIQRAIGSTIFSKGQGSTEEYNTFNENYFKARTFLEICFSHSGRSKALYDALLSDKADLTSRIASMRDAILQKQKNPPSVLNGLVRYPIILTWLTEVVRKGSPKRGAC